MEFQYRVSFGSGICDRNRGCEGLKEENKDTRPSVDVLGTKTCTACVDDPPKWRNLAWCVTGKYILIIVLNDKTTYFVVFGV